MFLTLPSAAGTSDKDINDLFSNAGPRGSQGSKPSDSQTFEGVITSSKQTGSQAGTQTGGQTGKVDQRKEQEQSGKQGGAQSKGITSGLSTAKITTSDSGDFTGTNHGKSLHSSIC